MDNYWDIPYKCEDEWFHLGAPLFVMGMHLVMNNEAVAGSYHISLSMAQKMSMSSLLAVIATTG